MFFRPILCFTFVLMCAATAQPAHPDKIVIAHRGASGYLPEHTLPAYAYAYAQGADYLEPDLVMTRDHALVALHDLHLESVTNVREQFPDRHREDGRWYAADFTLAEIQSLAVHERTRNRFPREKALFRVVSLPELIELVQGLNASTGREVGIYPELKAPAWHREQGMPFEETLVETLRHYGYDSADARCYVQSFEPESLKRLRHALDSPLRLIQLISNDSRQDELVTPAGLREIAVYANGIGPAKTRIEADPALVRTAQALGLKVHPYTFKKDDVPARYESYEEELRTFYFTHGVDGVFTDHPGATVEVLRVGGDSGTTTGE